MSNSILLLLPFLNFQCVVVENALNARSHDGDEHVVRPATKGSGCRLLWHPGHFLPTFHLRLPIIARVSVLSPASTVRPSDRTHALRHAVGIVVVDVDV